MIGQIDIQNLTHLGDAGIAIAILIVIVVIVLGWVQINRANNTTQQKRLDHEHTRDMRQMELDDARERERQAHAEKLQAEQIAADLTTAKALENLGRQMESSQTLRDTEQATIKTLATAATQLTAMLEQMVSSVETRDKKLDAIHTDLKTIPAETARLLKVQLSAIQADIQSWAGASSRVVDAIQTEDLADAAARIRARMSDKGITEMSNGELHDQVQDVKRKTGTHRSIRDHEDANGEAA